MIELDRLRITVGGTTVVHDVSLRVGPGERVGLVGASGSGKTLTALATVGLLPDETAVDGTVAIDGTDLARADDRTWRRVRGSRVAMVFQEPSLALNPLLTIGQQFAIPLRRLEGLDRREARTRAEAACASVSLEAGVLDRRPHELSGGQRQRACLAIALVRNPAVLVADEPTTALDPTVQHEVLVLLDDLVRSRGLGLLLVSHDLAVVAARTDRVVVLERGRVAETSPSGSLRTGGAASDAGRRLVEAAMVSDRRIGSLSEGRRA
jgi:ABC-type glutathione transport system ATPase component